MKRNFIVSACLLWGMMAAYAACGQTILNEGERAHLNHALDALNMTERDLGFAKDHAEPKLVLENVRRLLHEPMKLPEMGDRVLSVLQADDPDEVWRLIAELLEVTDQAELLPVPEDLEPAWWNELDEDLARGIARFIRDAEHAYAHLDVAFGDVSMEERRAIAASDLVGLFNAEDRGEVRGALEYTGFSPEDLQTAIDASLAIDPEPHATHYLGTIERVDRTALVNAGRIFQQAVRRLLEVVSDHENWPNDASQLSTPFGNIYLGSTGDDTYRGPALLIVDPGGDDRYAGAAGSANGLKGRGLSCILDLEGDDLYRGAGILGPAAALFGVAVVMDGAGRDTYLADYVAQGGALYGVAWLEDRGGDDLYRSYALSQAAGYVGVGMLRDLDGNDVYDVGLEGQGFAGLYGLGVLVDDRGNDRYLAGGREPDHERHPDRYLSLSQGFAIGRRPFAGGGVAALVDLEGNDTYEADIYGQGVSYWYSAAFLLDASGNDSYHVHHYGQGSGIHLSSGLLWDGEGNDKYTGYILSQGNAHDYAVGMLFDKEGDDTYTADHHAQARAVNNSVAILVDTSGDDGYLARQNGECQGIGNTGGHRDYGSLALLLDLDGKDFYSCGAVDGARMQRPLYGIIYDTARAEEQSRE